MDARKVILTRGPGRAELVSGRTTQIFQNELEATEFRVVVHVERECDIERITRKELLLLDTFCHVDGPRGLNISQDREAQRQCRVLP